MFDYLYIRVQNTLANKEGVGVVELILILVVLIGLVMVFKTNLNNIVTSIFKTITSNIKNI